ncbi:MAG: rhomboid family intramembrane serine protease [Candidatus Bilamarchaeaceae archaeon]
MVALGLIFICVLVFLLQNIEIVTNYAMITGLDFMEPWRFITSMFLHADFSHLFFNMFALLMFGPYLERKVGSTMFLSIYLLSGIIGGLGFELFSQPGVLGLGASGAIYGIFGALVVLEPKMVVYLYFVPVPITVAAVFYALIELASMGAIDNIGHAAHLFGLMGGYFLAIIHKRMRSDDVWS